MCVVRTWAACSAGYYSAAGAGTCTRTLFALARPVALCMAAGARRAGALTGSLTHACSPPRSSAFPFSQRAVRATTNPIPGRPAALVRFHAHWTCDRLHAGLTRDRSCTTWPRCGAPCKAAPLARRARQARRHAPVRGCTRRRPADAGPHSFFFTEPGAGAGRCTDCAAGSYSGPNAGGCSVCGPGTYSGGGASSCTSTTTLSLRARTHMGSI